jgi:hypothetical protein
MGNTKFQNYVVLEPGTKVLIPATVDKCILGKNSSGGVNVEYRLLVEKSELYDNIAVYRTIDQIIFDDLSRYSDEELKQELLKREALKSGGARGYDIT